MAPVQDGEFQTGVGPYVFKSLAASWCQEFEIKNYF